MEEYLKISKKVEKYAVFVEKKLKKAGSMPPCAAFLHSVQKCEIEGRGGRKDLKYAMCRAAWAQTLRVSKLMFCAV